MELLLCTASLPGGSERRYSFCTVLYYLGAESRGTFCCKSSLPGVVGSGTPLVHCPTNRVQWKLVCLSCGTNCLGEMTT